MVKHKCIFCLESKAENEFNREHVIPQMMGVYENNQVLNNFQVCKECNTHFNKHIENILSFDSLEALYRTRYRGKRVESGRKLTNGRVKYTASSGQFSGLDILPISDEGENKFKIELAPCIGYRDINSGEEYRYFSMDSFPFKNEIEKPTDSLFEFIWWGVEDDKVFEALLERGYDVRMLKDSVKDIKTDYNEDGIDVDITGTKDIIIERFIAKILLNFACYRLGKQYVLNKKFDNIRQFARYGKRHPSIRSSFSIGKVDHFEHIGKSHFIALMWGENYKSVYGVISWFNELKYTVRMAQAFDLRNIPLPISIYDNDSHTIENREELLVLQLQTTAPANDDILI